MKSICFAYYADGKWIGWYGGTAGSVSSTPKVYSSLESMRPVITKNLTSKLKRIAESSFEEEKDRVTGLAALGLLIFDGEEQLRGKEIELKVVECPEYDGPNPDFDKVAHDIAWKKAHKEFEEAAKELPEGPSLERLTFVKRWREEHPEPKSNDWIYADYQKVREWAKEEPTVFIETIKPAL